MKADFTSPVRVLRVIPTLDVRFGGPVSAMTSSVREMSRRRIATDILVADGDSCDDHPFLHDPFVRVISLGRARTSWRWVRGQQQWLRENIRVYDLVVVHCIEPHGAFATWRAAKAAGTGYVVFVHGSLDPWFRRGQPLKYLKKWLAWPWALYPLMRDADAVCFTSEREQTLASRSFRPYSCVPRVVRYGIEVPQFLPREAVAEEIPYILYLGRIHPKKGLDILVRAVARSRLPESRLRIVIAGPDQVGMQRGLVALARRLGVDQHLEWRGHVSGDAKWALIRRASALILPSHAENFGVVVAESLGCGIPTLLTDKVNIAEFVRDADAGLVATDDEEGITKLITDFTELSTTEREAMGARARALYSSRFTVEGAVDDLIALARERALDLDQRGSE